mgnify:CR=1 FL=1
MTPVSLECISITKDLHPQSALEGRLITMSWTYCERRFADKLKLIERWPIPVKKGDLRDNARAWMVLTVHEKSTHRRENNTKLCE